MIILNVVELAGGNDAVRLCQAKLVVSPQLCERKLRLLLAI